MEDNCKVFVVGNFKGGVGKTKLATMLAFDSATIFNKKTLLIDLDPQANASEILAKTGGITEIRKTITDGLAEGDLEPIILQIIENLDLIPCNTAFRNFPKFIYQNYSDDQEAMMVISNLIEPLREKYDYIYIDVPPTISDFSDNAMMAADYSIIAFQTSQESLDGVRKYIGYQNFLAERHNANIQVVGIVACMLKKESSIDRRIIEEAKEEYGNVVLDTIITYQERIKGYSVDGIHLNKNKNGSYEQWDYRAHNTFIEIINELNANESLIESVGE